MNNILDFYARTHTAFLHARGRAGTAFLLKKMAPAAGQRILEIGFGTGQTLVELACRFRDLELYGIERSPEMLATTRRRFRFAGINDIRIVPLHEAGSLPGGFFDMVYCESVLAILPDADLDRMWCEIHRLLRPGGSLFFNESLWREGVPAERIRAINRRCQAEFGIPQASETWAYPSDWRRLAGEHGFQVQECTPLGALRLKPLPPNYDPRLLRSRLFSLQGKIKSRFFPGLNAKRIRYEQAMQSFAEEGPFLEGVFFHCGKGTRPLPPEGNVVDLRFFLS